MTKLKVLISGAGIAGTCLAFWLSKLGHDVTVIERFPSLRSTGLQIDLRGHGIEVLRRMGLEPAFRSKSIEEQGWEIVDKSGKRKAFFAANKSGKGLQSFTSDFEIMRGDLIQLLHDASQEQGVRYIFGTSIKSLKQCEDNVEVLYLDGLEDHFDLIVGADGQASTTRKMMLGPDVADSVQYSDMWYGYFTVSCPIQEDDEYIATMYLATGSRFVLTRRHSPEKIQVYLSFKPQLQQAKEIKKGEAEKEKMLFTKTFQGAGWRSEEFLDALNKADDLNCERPGLIKVDPWWSGRVVLVGDAAYSPAVNGMGVTSGMVGAYVLAGEIAKLGQGMNTKAEISAALGGYDRIFRPFMDQVQRGASKNEVGLMDRMLSTSFGVAAFNLFLGLASRLSPDMIGRWTFNEGVKDWELPLYEEMVGLIA